MRNGTLAFICGVFFVPKKQPSLDVRVFFCPNAGVNRENTNTIRHPNLVNPAIGGRIIVAGICLFLVGSLAFWGLAVRSEEPGILLVSKRYDGQTVEDPRAEAIGLILKADKMASARRYGEAQATLPRRSVLARLNLNMQVELSHIINDRQRAWATAHGQQIEDKLLVLTRELKKMQGERESGTPENSTREISTSTAFEGVLVEFEGGDKKKACNVLRTLQESPRLSDQWRTKLESFKQRRCMLIR